MDFQGDVSLESLPNELLLDIFAPVCKSQSMYRSLLLVNRRFNGLVKFDRLPYIPIHVASTTRRCFYEFVACSELAPYVRYLWINGRTSLCSQIAFACKNLVSLACSNAVLYDICSTAPQSEPLEHTTLTEVTLFETLSRSSWANLKKTPHDRGLQLCRQITHLRLHEPLTSDFDPELFPKLTHYSCTLHPNNSVDEEIAQIAQLPKLKHIVVTTYFWKDRPPNGRTLRVLERDKRVRLLFFGKDQPGEHTLWAGRAAQEDSIWTRRMDARQLL